MADDEHDGPDDDAPDTLGRSRRDAEGAAADLARMGIDPRSLGLGDAVVPPRTPDREPEPDEPSGPRAPVVPIRPEFAQQPVQQDDPAGAPSTPARPTFAVDARAEQPPPTDAPRTISSIEQLLARTQVAAPAPHRSRGLVRSVTKGLVTADAAEAVQGDREVVDAVRHRQVDRRVVTFLSGKGGTGCTSVAVGVGTSLMALRDDRTVVADVQQGSVPLGALHGADTLLTIAAAAAAGEALSVPHAPSGLGLVDGGSWDAEVSRREVVGALDALGADHTFVLFDAGHDAGAGAHAALARADQVVVVGGPGMSGVAGLAQAVDRVRDVNPTAASRLVHVVVCPQDESFRAAHREVVAQLAVRPEAVVVVPPDAHLGAGHPFDPARVGSATREAFLRVAAAVALGAHGPSGRSS